MKLFNGIGIKGNSYPLVNVSMPEDPGAVVSHAGIP